MLKTKFLCLNVTPISETRHFKLTLKSSKELNSIYADVFHPADNYNVFCEMFHFIFNKFLDQDVTLIITNDFGYRECSDLMDAFTAMSQYKFKYYNEDMVVVVSRKNVNLLFKNFYIQNYINEN